MLINLHYLFTLLVELFGMQEMPRIIGVMYMVQGMASMVGTPVAGVVIRGSGTTVSSEDYVGMATMASVLMFAAAATCAWVRMEVMVDRAGGKWQWKWKL